MSDMWNKTLRRVPGVILLGVLLASPAGAEVTVSVYGGSAGTFGTRVDLTGPGGTGLSFHPVEWSGESFASPIYYGIRVLARPGSGERSGWGFGLDFIHAKMFADLEDTVDVEGNRNGVDVAGEEALGGTFTGLSFSHGCNLLLGTAIHRWVFPDSAGGGWLRRLHPYAGLGAGLAIPHVEVTLVDGSSTQDYQVAGPAFEVLAGAEVSLLRPVAAFLEGKVTYASLDADLTGGSRLGTRPWTVHGAFGVTLSLPFGP